MKKECDCKLCRLGIKFEELTNKYKMNKEDISFLHNDIFGIIEGQDMEIYWLRKQLDKLKKNKV